MARYAIFLEEVKYFLKDNWKDLIWLVRAAHHLPASELNGQERLPRDEGALRRLVSHLYTLKKEHFREFRPQPWSKPKFFPLVYVVTTCDDCTEVQLKRLERMRFSRGGIISVIRIPDQPWCRESSQDVHPRDKWAWGTLMPLYFKVIGKLEQHWLVNFFGTQWDGDELIINQQVNQEFFQRQWNADSDKLFARHVGLALVHPHPTSPDRVLLLTVFQHDPEDDVTGGAWAVPGGSVDRGKDRNWIQAAMREFEEEVNPSGDAQWSAAAAFSSGEYQLVSLQNLLPETDIQNMSRPCLNFVVARAKPAFYRLTQTAAPHADGGQQLQLPTDFVTELPIATAWWQREMWRYWADKNLPLLEHDRFLWLELDLNRGIPLVPANSQVHNYVKFVAKALQRSSAPRASRPALEELLQPQQPAPYAAEAAAAPWNAEDPRPSEVSLT